MDPSIARLRALWLTIACCGMLLVGRASVSAERDLPSGLRVDVEFNADGIPDGSYRLLDSEGRTQVTGTLQNGKRQGIWSIWDPQGSKRAELTYLDDVKEGSCRMWYGSTVFPQSVGQQKLEVVFAADEQDGRKKTWWPNGSRRCETTLDHGSIVKAQCWADTGDELAAETAAELARGELDLDAEYLDIIEKDIANSIK